MSEKGHPLRDHPAVVEFLSDGAEVHIAGRTSPASSMVARMVLAAGIGVALTFMTPTGTASAPEPAPVTTPGSDVVPPPPTGPPDQDTFDEADADAAFARILAEAGLENAPDAGPKAETRTPGGNATTTTSDVASGGATRGDDAPYYEFLAKSEPVPVSAPKPSVVAAPKPVAAVTPASPELLNLAESRPIPAPTRMAAAAVASPAPAMEISRSTRDPGFDAFPLRSSLGDEIDFKGRKVSRDVAATIFDAAQTTGASPVLMMAMADKESSFQIDARPDGSSALGLYQFLEATWLEVVKLYGAKHGLAKEASAVRFEGGKYRVDSPVELKRILDLRGDPGISALMACETHLAARTALRKRIGEEPSPAEAYLAHFMGTNGAGQLLEAVRSTPQANASRMFPKAAKANPAVFHEGPRKRPRNVRQVNEVMLHAVQVRVDRYVDIEEKMAPAPSLGMGR